MFSAALAAQGSEGSLVGQLTDSAGAAIPHVPIVLRNSANHDETTLTTGADGRFSTAQLVPGTYEIIVTSPAWGLQHAEIRIEENRTTIAAIAPGVVTYFAAEGNGLHSDGRTYLDAIRETASITGEGSALNSYGMRAQSNSFVLDGLDIHEPWTRGPIVLPPPEAIEIATIASGYVPASFGHLTGAAIIARSPSGSNAFHGTVFEDVRNSALAARSFFDGDKPSSNWNRLGGTLGGPVRKDNWFFFGAADLLRSKNGQTIVSTVPTAAQRAGNFQTSIYDPLTISSIGFNIFARQPFSANQIPAGRIPLAVQKHLSSYPLPNLPDGANNFRYAASSPGNSSFANVRTDKTFTERHTLSIRLNYQGNHDESPSAFPNAAASDPFQNAEDTTTNTRAWVGAVSLSSFFRSNFTNQLRAGHSRFDANSEANDNGPTINLTGYTSLGAASAAPFRIHTLNYEVNDAVAWTTRHHAWRFGFQAVKRQANGNASEISSRGNFIFTPDYTSFPGSSSVTGSALASFLLGFPSEVQRNVQLTDFALRAWEWSGFVQDQFRYRRLSVEAGLRYSLLPPVNDANGHIVNFNFSKTAPAFAQSEGNGGLSYNKRALAPRIGLALKLWEGTVLRGGFSKNFDTGTYLTMGRLARNAPYASQFDMVNGTFQLGANISAGLPAPSLSTTLNATTAVNAIQPETFTPYSDQWDLFLQRRLKNDLIVEIGGLGSMGIHLYAAYDANQPFPAPTPYATPRYPFEPFHGRVNYLNLGGGSTYYAGQVRLSGHIVRNLTVQFTYAFAKSLDDATAPGTTSASRPSGPQYIYDPRSNRGPSTFDVTQRVVLSANYAVRKFTLGALVTLQSGFPFTPELATNSLNNGGYQLPDRVAMGSIPSNQRSPLHWFDTTPGSSFRVPALYQYGNSGFGILRGPGLATADVALSRVFTLRENLRLSGTVEALNLLNRANFALPNRMLGVESAGMIDHTVTPGRRVELVVRLTW